MFLRIQRHDRARDLIQTAEKLLFTVNSLTSDQNAASRHQDAGAARILNLRQRSQTVRPKTTYFPDETDAGGSSAGYTNSGDHVISYPQLVSHPTKSKTFKEKEKKKVMRSSTFRNKEKKEDKKEEKPSVGVSYQQGNHSEENSARSEQIYIRCITALKSSLEEIMVRAMCGLCWCLTAEMCRLTFQGVCIGFRHSINSLCLE